MRIVKNRVVFDPLSAIDALVAIMMLDARCDEEAICVVFLNDHTQCVVNKSFLDSRAEFSCRDLRSGKSVVLGGYQVVQEGDVQCKDWFCTEKRIAEIEISEDFIESEHWNNKMLEIMTSLLSKMEVISKTTKAGSRARY